MHRTVWSLAGSALLVATAALAGEAPDLQGRWTGTTHTIIAGSGGHWPSSKGTFDRPALLEKEIVVDVLGQQDRRFWGRARLQGGGEDTSEPFVGELDTSLRRIVIADTDGFFWGDLLETHHVSFCYAHTGGRTGSTAVNCSELRRKP